VEWRIVKAFTRAVLATGATVATVQAAPVVAQVIEAIMQALKLTSAIPSGAQPKYDGHLSFIQSIDM
jgi:hypothetical protein